MKPETIITKTVNVEVDGKSIPLFITNDYAVVLKEIKRLNYKIPLLEDYQGTYEYFPDEIREEIEKTLIEHHTSWGIYIAEDYIAIIHFLDTDTMGRLKINISLSALIREKNDKTQTDKTQLLLEYASLNKTVEIEQLIKDGVDVNFCDEQKSTALMYAAYFDSPDSASILLKLGADVNAKNKNGYTALMITTWFNAYNTAKELLKSSHLNIEEKDNSGTSALTYAAGQPGEKILTMLIESGADVNTMNLCGITPLHKSARFNYISCTEILIKNGANINQTNNHNETPLIVATYYDNVEIAEKLLSLGADFTVKDCYGHSALCHAAHNDSFDCTSLFLKKCNISDEDLDLAIIEAARSNHTQTLKLLLDNSKDQKLSALNAVMGACIENHPDVIKCCKEYNCDLNEINQLVSMTPLMAACYCGSKESVGELIYSGVDVNCADEYGMTALMYASMVNSIDIVLMLLSNGADKTAKDKNGKTFEDYSKINETRSLSDFIKCRNSAYTKEDFEREEEIPEEQQPFIERFQWYKQKYFERFPDNKEPDIYHAAKISKQTFSKIQSKRNTAYHPHKPTIIQLALGLRLNIDETRDLLQSAGYVLLDDDKIDNIIKKFITELKTDPHELNEYIEKISGSVFFQSLKE